MSALLHRPTTRQPSAPPTRPARPANRRGRRGFAAAALLAGTLALVGCSSSGDDGGNGTGNGDGDATEGLDLNGRSFTSTEVQGRPLVTGTTVSLVFEDDQISAEAGCNTIFGGITSAGGVLTTTGELAMTSMGCERGLAAQDEWLSAFLASEPAIALEGETLVLGDDNEGITLTEGES